MNIHKLINPKTELYLKFKEFVLSNQFVWYWMLRSTPESHDKEGHYATPFLSHNLLKTPGSHTKNIRISESNSPHLEFAAKLFLEVLEHNDIKINAFLRINANCVLPLNEVTNTIPHMDHPFPHKNILAYLTDAGGKIIVGEDSHDPKEDDVILFEGLEHYHQIPKASETCVRRVALVATFF